MASSTPSLSKTSNPPLSSSTRLIPHQPQFMETESQHHQQQREKKLGKIQNTQFIEENLMPINFSSSSSSTNSSGEIDMTKTQSHLHTNLQGQRSRRKSSRILRSLTTTTTPHLTSLQNYPVLDTLPPATSVLLPPTMSNSNYHLKWNDHVNSTVTAIQCLLANETFVDVTLVCDEDDLVTTGEDEKTVVNGNCGNSSPFRRRNSRRISRRDDRRSHRYPEDEMEDTFSDEDDEAEWPPTKLSYQTKLKAHKVILSTCSEYFRKIFSENPCKHPVIVLKDFQQWEVRSLLDFMYKGQVIVRPERMETLVKAADALQIRGLRECIEKSDEWVRLQRMPTRTMSEGGSDNEVESLEAKTRVLNRTSDNTKSLTTTTTFCTTTKTNNSNSTPSHNQHQEHGRGQVGNEYGPSSPKLLNLSMSGGEGMMMRMSSPNPSLVDETNGPQTTIMNQTGETPTQHNHQINPSASSPPFPRRKQARPRRRSGDFVAQDLRITVTPPPPLAPMPRGDFPSLHDFHFHHNNNKIHDFTLGGGKGSFERPPHLNHLISSHILKNWSMGGNCSPIGTPPHPHSSPMKHELDSDEGTSSPPDRFRSPPGSPDSPSPLFEAKHYSGDNPFFGDPITGMGFKASPPPPSFFLNLNNGHPLLGGGHHSDSESNNPESASTPPSVFSPAGHPLNGGNHGNSGGSHHGQHWPGLPLGPAPIFGRHRAQHSAPRGGPPRAWSNADLTEALHNVWNKKMTTSQASRIFGIPYNSLLMYVRGKYGKSLKLDLLKKGLDLALEKSNNEAAANSLNTNGTPIPLGLSVSSSSSISNNNNNNNNNTTRTSSPSQKPKSHTSHYSNSVEDSPPSGLTLTTHSHISTNNGGNGGGGCVDRTDPQDIIPPGFNPFSAVSSIFGDYPPPFPFPPALSHILPPVNHLSIDKVSAALTRGRNDGDK